MNTIDNKLEKIISKNTLAIRCSDCGGSGAQGQEKCTKCDGDGITEWRFETVIEEIKHLILSEIKKASIDLDGMEDMSVVQIVKETQRQILKQID